MDYKKFHIPGDAGERISFMGMDLVWKLTKNISPN